MTRLRLFPDRFANCRDLSVQIHGTRPFRADEGRGRFVSIAPGSLKSLRILANIEPGPGHGIARTAFLAGLIARGDVVRFDCRNGSGGRLSASIGRSKTLENWNSAT